MRRSVGAIAAVVLCCGAAPAAAEPGDRDPSYGASGSDRRAYGAGTAYRDVAATPDGGTVVAGRTSYTTNGPIDPLLVVKHRADGTPDPAFGAGGAFRRNFGDSGVEAHAVAVDPDGRIVVAARTGAGTAVVLRLTAGGQLDPAFSGDGIAAVPQATDVVVAGLALLGRAPVVALSVPGATPRVRSTLVARLTESGVPDTSWSGDGVLTVPDVPTDVAVSSDRVTHIAQDERLLHVPESGTSPAFTAVDLPDKRLAALADGVVVVSAAASGTSTFVRRARARSTGGLDGGVSSAELRFRAGPLLRGVAALSDGRVVAAVRTTAGVFPAGTTPPGRISLVRFAADGSPDPTFRPSGSPSYATLDGLGLPDGTSVDPSGGVARVADDKVVVAGVTDEPSAFVARYGAPGTAPTARLSRTYRAFGDPPSVRPYARPGQPVDLDARASTDPDGPLSFAWDVTPADGFETPGGGLLAPAFPPGEHQVTVKVRDETGLDDTASAVVVVRENQAPTSTAHFGQELPITGTPERVFEDRPTIFRVDAEDPDGRVARVEWDLDDDGTYDATGAATYTTFENRERRHVRVRITDDEGRSVSRFLAFEVVAPPCDGQTTVAVGRLRALAACWKKDVDGGTTTYTAARPLPALAPQTQGFQLSMAEQLEVRYVGKPVINGLRFAEYDVLQIVDRTGKPDLVQFTQAKIETVGPAVSRFELTDGSVGDTWQVSGTKISGVAARGRYAGMDVGELSNDEIALPAAGQARLSFYPILPAVFGGVSADAPVTITTGGAASAQGGSSECFRANGASLPGLDFLESVGSVNVCRVGGTEDRWTIDVKVDLDQFTGGIFPGLPKVRLQVEIAGGQLVAAAARGEWDADNGFPLVGPVFLTGIDFQLLLGQSSFVKPECVPKIGQEVVSLQFLRDLLLTAGLPASEVYEKVPDIRYDHGVPSSALCGGVDFRIGMPNITLARGGVDLGVANYSDGRPDAFRLLGRARILDLVDLDMQAAVYSNGFMDMHVRGYAELLDFLSLEARFGLSVDIPNKRFNAQAYVEGCITPVDFCAGLRALLSSKGIGACLLLSFLGADWEPGAVYSWKDGLDVYFSGCDLGSIRVNFSGSGSTIITPEPVAAPSAFKRMGAVGMAAQRKPAQDLDVPAGLPGVYVAVRGEGGALPKFTLTGPGGTRVTVDGTVSPKPVRSAGWQLLHDPKRGISHVFVGRPRAGRWTVTPDAGSAPIVEVVSSLGLAKPKLTARVVGSGRRRALVFKTTSGAPKGQVVRFEERGATGKQLLGRATGASGRLAFTSAPGRAERRTIVAVVEQDGMLREEVEVARYRAPRTSRPTRPGRVIARRGRTRGLDVRWLPAADAEHYEVTVTLDDARKLRRVVRRGRRLVLPRIARSLGARVRVVGINEVGEAGRAGTLRVRPVVKARKRPAAKRRG